MVRNIFIIVIITEYYYLKYLFSNTQRISCLNLKDIILLYIMPVINISQYGIDGMGHQLYGLLSCLILHNIGDYYFDGHSYINSNFKFQHLPPHIINDVKAYMIEIVKNFINKHNQQKKIYNNKIHAHEINNIPVNYSSDTLYTLDNAFLFHKIPMNNDERIKHKNNIEKYKELFINSKLPKNRLCEKNIVIHLRQGDAMYSPARREQINIYNKKLIELINIFAKKYNDYTYYIHTDGDPTFITNILNNNNIPYKLFFKDEHVLNVLSDLIYSKILICGCSGLSLVCTFLGEHELIIKPDTTLSTPDDAVRIDTYINNNIS